MAALVSLTKTNLDDGAVDTPAQARAELASNVDASNALVDLLNSGTPGQVLTAAGGGNAASMQAASGAGTVAFCGTLANWLPDVTGDGTVYTVEFDSKSFDIGSNFNTLTGVFTAPVSGYYLLTGSVRFSGITASHTVHTLTIVTTGEASRLEKLFSPGDGYKSIVQLDVSSVAYMNADDTAKLSVCVNGGTKVIDILSGNGQFFSGVLLFTV